MLSTCMSSQFRTEMLSFFANDLDFWLLGDESACTRVNNYTVTNLQPGQGVSLLRL